ncbi:MAG: hypothetical protein QXY40_07985 [Candidatus Methanomethylicia archaeon]
MISRINTTHYSLDATIYPSYTYALFRVDNGWWIKQYGFGRRGKMKLINESLEYTGFTEEEIMDLSGLWYDPIFFLNDLDSKLRETIKEIINTYRYVRISISPYDRNLIFILTFLSRRTDFHINVVKWASKLFSNINDIDEVLKINISSIGNSYQLKQLREAVGNYLKVIEDKISDPWSLRMKLLEIRNVGPKIADAFILFHTRNSWIAPSDIHYQNFTRRLNIFRYSSIPEKKTCLKYTCIECIKSNTCLTGLSYYKLGKIAGWLQTVSYIHDKKYCSRSKCIECKIKHLCER